MRIDQKTSNKKNINARTEEARETIMNSNENSKAQTLKQRFIAAIKNGELGTQTPEGTIVTLKKFKQHFSEIETQYVSSFLPAATLEPGMITMTHTRFVFRLAKGVYRVHPDLLEDMPEETP